MDSLKFGTHKFILVELLVRYCSKTDETGSNIGREKVGEGGGGGGIRVNMVEGAGVKMFETSKNIFQPFRPYLFWQDKVTR